MKLFLSTMIIFQKQKVSGRGPKLILPVRMPNTFIIKLKKTNWIGRFLILQNSFLLELIFIIYDTLNLEIQTNLLKILWNFLDAE